VIAVSGSTVACLAGWRASFLVTNRNGSLKTVADLGWDARSQTTPQRRLLLHGGHILVLEPVSGFQLLPPLRVRRFDLDGKELACEEGGGPGPAHLSFHAKGSHVTRCGIDLATGKPTVEQEDLGTHLPGPRLKECSGMPLFALGAIHYPVRMRGLFRGGELLFDGDPGLCQLIGGDLVCAANRRGRPGVWRQGAWHALEGPRLFPDWRAPFGPLVAPLGQGLVVLRREGGPLPGLDAPLAMLPAGVYSALLTLEKRLVALREGETPQLVPVEA
jgi:hypothetical protein